MLKNACDGALVTQLCTLQINIVMRFIFKEEKELPKSEGFQHAAVRSRFDGSSFDYERRRVGRVSGFPHFDSRVLSIDVFVIRGLGRVLPDSVSIAMLLF